MTATFSTPMVDFQRQAAESEAFLKSFMPGELRGKEKREMEKQLRRARVASRLLERYATMKGMKAMSSKSSEADLDENTDISTASGSYFWKVRSMAAGVSDSELPFWTFKVCDEMGVDGVMRRHLSDQFLIVQAIDSMARRIQDRWFAYKRRKSINGNDQAFDFSLTADMLDPMRFTWHPGMQVPDLEPLQEEEEHEAFEEEQAAEDHADESEAKETEVDRILSRLNSTISIASSTDKSAKPRNRRHKVNYMSKTEAAVQRENATVTPAERERTTSRKPTLAEKESYLLQAKSRMGSFKDNSQA